MTQVYESQVEELALDWLEHIGWRTAHGPDIAPDTPSEERPDYTQVVLEQRLCDAIARLNVNLPSSTLDDALRKLLRPEDVVDIFAAAGLEKPDISILSDQFLAEVRGMKKRILAVELLQ